MTDRDVIRRRLLHLAETDPAVTGAAIIGSHATGDADRWSDIDLAFAVDGPLDAVMRRWTRQLYADFAAIHHWDLPAGPTIYRVFLLPDCMEVDIAFSPEPDFGPRGPAWRQVFGDPPPSPPPPPSPAPAPSADHEHLAGLAWHHALHARISIERGRLWQAKHWITALRAHTITLACRRLALPSAYAKGAHLLPPDITGPLETTLVRSLDEPELRRALACAATLFAEELARSDPALAARLRPTFDAR